MDSFLHIVGLKPRGSAFRPGHRVDAYLRTAAYVGFLIFVAILINACGDASNPMAAEAETAAAKPAAAGGDSGDGDADNAYPADGGTGVIAGYNETDAPDYGIVDFTLWAGKTHDAGTVTITSDDENTYVTYSTNGTADLGEVHVYVWTDPADIPGKRPAPGHAPYTAQDLNSDSFTVAIPTATRCGDVLYISAHAALVADATGDDPGDDGLAGNDGETAYAGGDATPEGFVNGKGAWWGYVTYTVDCYYNVAGAVYEDADDNGDLGDGEGGFEGIVVHLLDGAGAVIATTATGADGAYFFEHVPAGGDYSVEVAPGPPDHYATENAEGSSIAALAGDATGTDFGFIPHFDVSGTIAVDTACGDAGEGLPEVEVMLTSDAGTIRVTTAGGAYRFADVRGYADYTISASVPEGFIGEVGAEGVVLQHLSADVTGAGFTYCPLVFGACDANQDGTVDSAEQDLCGDEGDDDGVSPPTVGGDGEGGGFHETAYAFGNVSFCADLGSSRWGWVNEIDVTASGTLAQPIYAGAGQCDPSKGTEVGALTITWSLVGADSVRVDVAYDMATGYYVNATHTWIGEDLPMNLIANGNFTVVHENERVSQDAVSHVVEAPADGRLHVIAHMEAVD